MGYTDTHEKNWWRLLLTLGAIALTVALIAAFSSCHTVKSDTAKLSKIDYRHPLVPANFCASKYPPKDSTSIVKEYIQGEDVVRLDTVTEYQYETISDTVYATKYITKTVTKTDTLRDTRYIKEENKARIVVLNAEIDKYKDTVIRLTDSRNDWRLWCLVLGGAWIAYIIFKVIKRKYVR